jgi:hypothetical protein
MASTAPPIEAIRPRSDNFSVEVDNISQTSWSEATRAFRDANIYQTWPYATARAGRGNVSYLLLRRDSTVVAACEARLIKIPYVNLKVAYVFWGPLWQRHNDSMDVEVFRQAVRALRAEYVDRRGLVVRIISNLTDCENRSFQRILEEEGYLSHHHHKSSRTILMDVRPSLEALYQGFHQKWRNCLNGARRQQIEIVEGEDDTLFDAFERIYMEMKDRKRFISSTDLKQYRQIQSNLPTGEKMHVFLSKIGGELCAGAICSALGDSGIYLFGATNSLGMKTNASYLVQWRVLEWLKEKGCECYDLNGINPEENEGTYRFKSRLAGKYGHDVNLLGQFDAYPNAAIGLFVRAGEHLRAKFRKYRSPLGHFLR